MPRTIEDHRAVFAEQGCYPLGMVSPTDSYWLQPETWTLIHGLHDFARTRWFREQSDPMEVFVVLFCCVRYHLLASSLDVSYARGVALLRMRVFVPGFTIPGWPPLGTDQR